MTKTKCKTCQLRYENRALREELQYLVARSGYHYQVSTRYMDYLSSVFDRIKDRVKILKKYKIVS